MPRLLRMFRLNGGAREQYKVPYKDFHCPGFRTPRFAFGAPNSGAPD
jgi:hypothetical protein